MVELPNQIQLNIVADLIGHPVLFLVAIISVNLDLQPPNCKLHQKTLPFPTAGSLDTLRHDTLERMNYKSGTLEETAF